MPNPADPTNSHLLRKYSNFRDPVGLLLRMLGSKNRAAYWSLFREAASVAAKPLDLILRRSEKKLLYQHRAGEIRQPLLLIVGPPRSGSTLLYQLIARFADVSHFTNLSAVFPHATITSMQRFGRNWRSHGNAFTNYYGQTVGWHAPNEGFEVWNRWLGEDRYHSVESLSPDAIGDMRSFFSAWTQCFPCPFLNKNNRNLDCLSLLVQAMPEVRPIVIRRDPFYTAQSLIRAREQVQGGKSIPWGLASDQRTKEDSSPLGYIEEVCYQLAAIEEHIRDQLNTIQSVQPLELTYEDLCTDPQGTLQKLTDYVPTLKLHTDLMEHELSPFEISTSLSLNPEEKQQLEHRLADFPYSGSNYHRVDKGSLPHKRPTHNFSKSSTSN